MKTVWVYDAGNGKTIEFPADKARERVAVNDPEGVVFEHPAPDPDPNEAYDAVPMKPEPHGPPGDWWTVTKNGIPDRHFSASQKTEAERYATDPAHRAAIRGEKTLHEK
jgi:hypothetical protein